MIKNVLNVLTVGVVVLFYYLLIGEYISCDGTLVRTLYWVECLNNT